MLGPDRTPRVFDVTDSVDRVINPSQRTPAGFASRAVETVRSVALPPSFIDRCRRAYLGINFTETQGPRLVGVTSSLHGEGKTMIAMGIATAIAADTQRPTLLLECDLEGPSLYRHFGFSSSPGLVDWLEDRAALRIMRASPLVNLFIAPSGAPREDPSRLFYLLTQGGLIEDLKQHFSTVIVDLPPMLSIAYSSIATQLADHIVLVAKYGVTTIDDLEKTVFLLGRERLAGIVLNGTEYKTPEWLRRLL
jgi:Mrp family chromosome partitioning ATPase